MPATKSLLGSILTIGIALTLLGCDSGGASMDQMVKAADAEKVAKQQQDEAAATKAAADKKAAAPAQSSTDGPKKVGARQTQGLGGGYYAAIIGARRHVMNVVDSLSWIQGVRSFKAEEGRKPKNSDEFMRVVVTKYDLQLPKIEDDEEYLYDPNGETDGDFGQLYVVKKGTAPEALRHPALHQLQVRLRRRAPHRAQVIEVLQFLNVAGWHAQSFRRSAWWSRPNDHALRLGLRDVPRDFARRFKWRHGAAVRTIVMGGANGHICRLTRAAAVDRGE